MLRIYFGNVESAKVEIDALEDAERELMKVESTTSSVEAVCVIHRVSLCLSPQG